jgi:hypothetical protein
MPAGGARSYSARTYHDLVDMPFFVGAFDVDSQQVQGKWVRVASYPEGQLARDERRTFWEQVQRMFPPMIDAMGGDVPYDTYTILTVFDSSSQGGERAGACQLAPRHLHAVHHRQPRIPVHHGARDLSPVEREADAPDRHGPVPLRSGAAHHVALGERGDHRLLRRSRIGARRASSTPPTFWR